jgi:hypothetical protein
MQMWNELSEVLGFNEFVDPTAHAVSKTVKDFQEIDDELKRRREPVKEERPSWYYQAATRPYPKGYRYPQGMGIARAIKEERIGTPLERFECFYEAETDVIQEAVKENLGAPGYMSYRDACNTGSWY